MGYLAELDRRLFARVAAGRLRAAHPVLPRLSRAADHGLLWFGTAAVLATVGGRTARRAALRGVGSLAAASLVTNTVAKWTVDRRRPLVDAVPLIRRPVRQPVSSSFPSGHSASAAAFAAGVALESTRYGAVVAPVAAGVAASRVYVGVHYPSDVLAGIVLGVGAAALTRRWWPPRPQVPAQAPRHVSAPALPEGRGLVIVVNSTAGTGPVPVLSPAERLRALLPGAETVEYGPDDDLGALLGQAARRAAEAGGALGVCGGDGSVNAAAAVAAEHRLPLAVFPGGTLNHFALDVGVPDIEDTAYAVTQGEAIAVDLARATPTDGRPGRPIPFVNTFGIGLYPELVHIREGLEKRLGKWPAAAVALARVLREGEPMSIEINGRPHRPWLLFVGNGRYAPEGFAPAYRPRLDDGLLDVRVVDSEPRLARTRLVLAALTGTLGRSHVYTSVQVRRLRLSGLHDVDVRAHDGEVFRAPDALVIDKLPAALTVYRPAAVRNEVLQTARAAAEAARRLRPDVTPVPPDVTGS
ncbi:phosphatase PAP2 family protein [Streptomyces pactum]|uniref:Phosphatase PAP2 family protein n=1 Tax=Streptomyces pactum TaxID=68249 RepID=A0ABS0NEJ6_9ACTN|nr:bifunctional phosphatase PAP2/diacylglycerol kinase family protein [Streptomyces pactum]MBH5333595.1 phosphatase PAP2 family protein [Streptomyces pactum]